MKGIHIHIAGNSPALNQHRTYLRGLIRRTMHKVDRRLSLEDIDIIVIDGSESMQPVHRGVTGLVYYDTQVLLAFDTKHAGFPRSLHGKLLQLLSHELHHVVRGRTAKDETLFERMITEGLAVDFEMTTDTAAAPPKKDWDAIDAISLIRRARPELDDLAFAYQDYIEWFDGSKQRNIPQFAGYAMGRAVVKRYMTDHPDTDSAQLVSTPAEHFRPYLQKILEA